MGKTVTPMNRWTSKKERGSPWTIRFMIWLCQHRNRWLADLLLYPIVAYFLLTAGSTRQASRHFFQLAKGSFSWDDHYQQLMCFARSLIDRVSILMGESRHFEVKHHGRNDLIEMRRKGQGLILLGAHLGNFEACKILVKNQANINVHIVAYFASSKKIRSGLDAINPDLINNVIDPTSPDAVFQMRDVLENGGILAILGDRTGIGEKKLPVEFLGEPTFLPAGPYFLAAILGCPVFCFLGLRVDERTYETHAIKLADHIQLRRGHRLEEAQPYAQKYADFLGEKARQHPHNWFNFFEFWDTSATPDSNTKSLRP